MNTRCAICNSEIDFDGTTITMTKNGYREFGYYNQGGFIGFNYNFRNYCKLCWNLK